ncbi:RNA polymerase sigma factor [Phytohabitans rumicis]|uniref:RNA polymerase sigma factor n=1 Tax=Phytohabitans rumicis TaxID=1076125 RepID=A0A6V8L2S1_9ACTN|nr:sigma-70 family RNA polymerase sigma factor [Phytohabitans rumicis]GFJ88406.1 RNA polymerase sigma factor [Phytohabitans rumicis]
MRDDSAVVLLVTRARDGDRAAWDEVVERYAPLVFAVCRRYRLSMADAEDVNQSVWLRLVEHLSALREPAALPGWIATTTQRECLRLLRSTRRSEPVDPLVEGHDVADVAAVAVEEEVLAHERNAAARAAFGELPPRCQLLLSLLMRDPPVPYEEIGRRLHMRVGSIGPSRARCLDRMRRCPAIVALLDSRVERAGGGDHRGEPTVER